MYLDFSPSGRALPSWSMLVQSVKGVDSLALVLFRFAPIAPGVVPMETSENKLPVDFPIL